MKRALTITEMRTEIEDSAELLGRTIVLTGDDDEFSAPTTRPDDEPALPVKPEPVRYARPPANDNALRQPTEWEQRKAAQWRREVGRREWDKSHPELFVDTPSGTEMKWAQAIKATEDDLPPPPDDWPEWMDAEYEQDEAA